MKLILISNEGRQLACVDNLPSSESRNPAQVFALLDLLERLLETGQRGGRETGSAALSEEEAAVH